MARDLGAYLRRLTSRAPGGRRLTAGARATEDRLRSGRRPRGRGVPSEGTVTIEYSPRLDGDPDPGEVVWTWVPFEEDAAQGKDRPVVVIGRRGDGLVAVPLTSQRDDREAQVAIGTGAWDRAGRPSDARIWRMLDIDGGRMRREGAVLDRARFDEVVAAVDRYDDVRGASPSADSGLRRS